MAILGGMDCACLGRSWFRGRMVELSLQPRRSALLDPKPDRRSMPDMWIHKGNTVVSGRADSSGLAV